MSNNVQGVSNPGYQPAQPPFQGGYAPQGGQYPPQQPQGGAYPPQQPQGGAYPPQQPGVQYHPQGGQYPPQQQGGQFQQAPQYQGGQYPQKGGQFPPQGNYPPQQQASASPYQQASAPGQWDPAKATAFQGETGHEDVDENAQMAEPQGAPPPSFDSVVSGYENANFTSEANIGPPPSYQDVVREAAHVDSTKVITMTAEDAKDALLEYVGQNCCWGSGAAKDMDIKEIQSTSALHYTLETFTETRSTKWHYVPYSGGMVDGPQMGPAPAPWEIPCSSTALFQSEIKKMEVPHTATVQACHVCFGCGFNRCWKCTGRGRVRCSWCHGSGRRHEMRDGHSQHVTCTSCHGSGRKRCMTCTGTGCVRCRECHGFGKIKQYIQLTVNFQNRLSDHIVERTDMPDHLIRDVTGDVIFEQIAMRVCPIEGYPEMEINRRAADIVGTHATSWPNDRVLQQRQKLRSVPVYECRFKFDDKEGRFWVYGNQRKVFTQDYPHTCCCCAIL